MTTGVAREAGEDERRVALVPADVGRLREAGLVVLVESGAGLRATFGDEAYAGVGAEVVTSTELLIAERMPKPVSTADEMRPAGQDGFGTLRPMRRDALASASARR